MIMNNNLVFLATKITTLTRIVSIQVVGLKKIAKIFRNMHFWALARDLAFVLA